MNRRSFIATTAAAASALIVAPARALMVQPEQPKNILGVYQYPMVLSHYSLGNRFHVSSGMFTVDEAYKFIEDKRSSEDMQLRLYLPEGGEIRLQIGKKYWSEIRLPIVRSFLQEAWCFSMWPDGHTPVIHRPAAEVLYNYYKTGGGYPIITI